VPQNRLVNFMRADVFVWEPLMASTIISALPPVIMVLIFQRWVVKGLTLGTVNGSRKETVMLTRREVLQQAGVVALATAVP